MAGIRCSNCDTLNREAAKFCVRCGTKLEAYAPPPRPSWNAPPQHVPEPYYPPTYQESPAAKPAKRSWLHITANLLAVFCGAAFVVFVSLALPFLDASDRIVDGELYKEALRDQDVYNRFPDLFAEQMVRSQASLGKEARIDFTGVGLADWKLIAEELVTPEWMQTQVENLIDEIFTSMEEDVDPPALKISLLEVTQRLSGDSGFRIYKEVIQTKRECGFDDLFEIVFWLGEDAESNLPICNIPVDLSEFIAMLGGYSNGDALIRDLLKELPDVLPEEILLSDLFTLPMDAVGRFIGMWRTISWFFLVLGALALLATFISPMGRTIKGALLLWGIPLAVAGLILLVVSIAMPVGLSVLITSGFKGSIAPGLAKVITEIGRYVSRSSATGLGWQAAVMLLVGLVMGGTPIVLWGVEKFQAARLT